NAQIHLRGGPQNLILRETRMARPVRCNGLFDPAQGRFHVVPFDQLIALPSLATSATRPSSQLFRTTSLLASVLRPAAHSPSSCPRSKTRPCWKMAHGWSSLPSYSHSPGKLDFLSGSAAPARPPSTSRPPAAATAFTTSRRLSFSVIEHPLSERGNSSRRRDTGKSTVENGLPRGRRE